MLNKLEVQIKDNKIYSFIRDTWLIFTPEEQVRQQYVAKLVNLYGYSLDQMAEELKVNNSKRGQGKARADIVIWKSKKEKTDGKTAFIVVECKAEKITVKKEDYYQGANYAAWAGASFFVTTNEKETKFFRVDKDSMPKDLNEIINIPKASIINNKKEVDKILSQTKEFSKEEFAKLLQKCHNIIRNNDKLSPEAAFDEISKILFMKIRYERNPDEDIIFSLDKFQRGEKYYEKNIKKSLPTEYQIPYMQYLFSQTKIDFAEDKLFDSHDTIKIKQYSFEQIVKELEKYNLSATSDDVKGIAFEQFLGTTFRGELGQFFTPRKIVDFMVEILDPQEGEIICDPCCGSGGFLIGAFDYIRRKIELDIENCKKEFKIKMFSGEYEKFSEKKQLEIAKQYDNILKKLNSEINVPNKAYSKQTEFEKNRRISKLSSNCIYGTDANPRMARTSKMNMIMHGDGHGGVHHHDGLINVDGIFEERFDVILTNPPFGSRVEKDYKLSETDRFYDEEKLKEYKKRYGDKCVEQIKELNEAIEEKQKILDRFDLGTVSSLTEVLFMERCLKLLKKGGRMGIVLPEGVLNNSNLQKVRDYFESKAKILLITSIPQDVFVASGATIKPSLLFFKRFTDEEELRYKKAKEMAEKEINKKYADEIKQIDIKFKKDKKSKDKALKEIKAKQEIDIKERIKELFNYEIPIAQVEKAGITTTGTECENELIVVAEEFKKYRDSYVLWTVNKPNISYIFNGENLIRTTNKLEEIIYE